MRARQVPWWGTARENLRVLSAFFRDFLGFSTKNRAAHAFYSQHRDQTFRADRSRRGSPLAKGFIEIGSQNLAKSLKVAKIANMQISPKSQKCAPVHAEPIAGLNLCGWSRMHPKSVRFFSCAMRLDSEARRLREAQLRAKTSAPAASFLQAALPHGA